MKVHLIFSFDDSSRYITFCANMLEKHGFKGTFYLNTKGLEEIGRKVIKQLHSVGHEIGSHSVTHCDLTKLSENDILYELKVSKEVLEGIIDEKVRSFAYPYGCFNKITKELARVAGYENARTTEPFNVYEWIHQDPYSAGVTFYTDPHALKDFFKAMRRLKWLKLDPLLLKKWDRLVIKFIEHVSSIRGETATIHILTHPTFLFKRKELQRFETLLQYLSSTASRSLTVTEAIGILGSKAY